MTTASPTVKIAATGGVALLLLPVLLGAAAIGVLGGEPESSSQPSAQAIADIPDDYRGLYRRAADLCPGLDWTVLAAVGKIESDHGRSPLPGIAPGTVNPAGAQGPMQVLDGTWREIRTRHPEIGPNVYDPNNAIPAAAYYICDARGADGDIRRALFAYNHSDNYVDAVLAQADVYRAATAARPGDIRLDWPPEHAVVLDPTTSGRLTPRTHALVRALQERGLTGDGIVCFGHRHNPDSDHPKGRACDIFVDPHDPASVADGWRIANWLIEHQARFATAYLVYQGQYWSATDPRWTTYRSTVYGCPDRANLTGCHYDHLHLSVS